MNVAGVGAYCVDQRAFKEVHQQAAVDLLVQRLFAQFRLAVVAADENFPALREHLQKFVLVRDSQMPKIVPVLGAITMLNCLYHGCL
jgi:hypothetical protein